MRGLLCLLLWAASLLPIAARADDEASPLGMSYVQAPQLELIYFDPLSFLVPHALRTYTNAIAFQQRIFEWTPSQPTGVLLKDFSDYGGGSTWVAPRDTMFLDIAPLSLAFETFTAAERLYSLMNH